LFYSQKFAILTITISLRCNVYDHNQSRISHMELLESASYSPAVPRSEDFAYFRSGKF